MSKALKFNRRVYRRSNVFTNLLTAALKGKMAEDDNSVPYLRPEDLLRDKPQNYVLQ